MALWLHSGEPGNGKTVTNTRRRPLTVELIAVVVETHVFTTVLLGFPNMVEEAEVGELWCEVVRATRGTLGQHDIFRLDILVNPIAT